MGARSKMRLPLLLPLCFLALATLFAATPGASSLNFYRRLQSPLMGSFLWGAADLPSWIKRTINVHQAPPTRFQRGVDPADESREVDMRMIFDELKKDLKAAMDKEKEESEMRTVWPEIEEDGSEQPVSYYQKYRL